MALQSWGWIQPAFVLLKWEGGVMFDHQKKTVLEIVGQRP